MTAVSEVFHQARKVLYMTHLAIGDYIYQRTFLSHLTQTYPNIELDVWFDDFRVKGKSWQQGRNTFLSDWLETESFINDIYPIASSKAQRNAMLKRAQDQGYDAVIFIASLRRRDYARFALKIAKGKFTAGVQPADKKLGFLSTWYFSRLTHAYQDTPITTGMTILDLYGRRFANLAQLESRASLLKVHVDNVYSKRAYNVLQSWHNAHSTTKAIIVNGISTTPKRDYDWCYLKQVITKLNQTYPQVLFIVNAPPHELTTVEAQVQALSKESTVPCEAYTAQSGVQELAAMVAAVDGVMSVETAIIHFASSMGTPLVALMRSHNRHWCPSDAVDVVYSDTIINDIPVYQVVESCQKYLLKNG